MFMTTLILTAISFAIQYMMFLLTKDDGKQKNKPPSKDQYNIAISKPGVAFPKFFGTVKMIGYSVVAWNITRQKRIVQKEKSVFGTKEIDTPNFETFVDMHAVFSIAERENQIDLLKILCNDNVVLDNLPTGPFTAYIDQKDLFGDDDGIYGNIEYYAGNSGQVKSSYINNMYNGNASKWPRIAHMIFKNFKMTNSTSSPTFSFIFRSMPVPYWTNIGTTNINGAINPVVAIYYTLVDNLSGAKMLPQEIDVLTFADAADKLRAMDFGIAYMRQSGRPIIDEISDILEVIDGNFYSDPLTGKICVSLNTYDYDVDTLEHVTMKDVINYKSSRNSISSQVTEVRVDYVDNADNFLEKTASFKNEATRLRKGKSEVKSFNYNMITDFKTAKRVATREGRALTNSLITLDLEMSSRKLSYLKVGDPVIVTLDKIDIYATPFRIMSLNLGKLKNTNIQVTLVQDRFGYFEDILSPDEEVIKTDRTADPVAVNLQVLDAPSYFNLNQNVADNLVLTFAKLPNNRQQYYEIWSDSSTTDGYIKNGTSTGFALYGGVSSDINVEDTTINIESDLFDPLSLQKDNLSGGQNMAVLINGSNIEFINFETVSYNNTTDVYTLLNVNRGLLDTIPKAFDSNTQLYVFSYGSAINNQDFFLDGESVSIKALTVTNTSKLSLSSAPTISHISSGRNKKPINVSNFKVNGVNFKDTQEIGDVDLTVNFSYRNKISTIQYFDEQINSNNDLNTVVIKVYNNLNTLIKTVNLSSGETSWTFDDEKTLNAGVYYNELRLEVNTLNSGLESVDKYNMEITRV